MDRATLLPRDAGAERARSVSPPPQTGVDARSM